MAVYVPRSVWYWLLSPLKFVKSSRWARLSGQKMCSKSGLLFVSVRRIYFTLPKERRCCDSHCLGKKPGCKLSETLRRESQHARTHSMTHTQTHTVKVGGAVRCVVMVCDGLRVPPPFYTAPSAPRQPLLGLHVRLLELPDCCTLWRKRRMRKRRTGGSVFFSHSTGIRVGLSPRRAEGKDLHKKMTNKNINDSEIRAFLWNIFYLIKCFAFEFQGYFLFLFFSVHIIFALL